MSLEEEIAEKFAREGWTWNLKNGTFVPDADAIQEALDEAARLLFNEEVGTQLEVGRLIIIKTPRAHDVYVLAGEYQ